jgi:hypothetical protein
MGIKYLLNILPAVVAILFIALAVIIYFCISSANRYVPTIKTSASSDGGKTYTDNLKSIPRPQNTDIYLKYEVSVKADGFWWRFFRNVIDFTIEYPPGFDLYDYTGVKKGEETCANSEAMYYSVTVSPYGEDNGSRYNVKDSKMAKKKETFSVVASDKPKKAEILFKLSDIKLEKDYPLTLSFSPPVHKVYNKMVTLGFNKE